MSVYTLRIGTRRVIGVRHRKKRSKRQCVCMYLERQGIFFLGLPPSCSMSSGALPWLISPGVCVFVHKIGGRHSCGGGPYLDSSVEVA
jgi:hypothetical protein